MQKTLLLTLFVGFCFLAQAQDKIIRNNGTTILCKIKEVGLDEVKYLEYNQLDGPLFSIAKSNVKRIEFENGKQQAYAGRNEAIKDPEQYAGQSNRAIKMNFLSPLLGFSHFTYEQSTGVGKSYEISLGVIGMGKNNIIEYNYLVNGLEEARRDQFGLFAGFGYKFNKLPDFLFGRTSFSHLMQGTYIKPVIYAGTYRENVVTYKNSQYSLEKQGVNFAAIHTELGKQWVFGDKMVLDAYWGLGYGFDNKSEDEWADLTAYHYVTSRAGRSPGLSFSIGLRIGLLLKNKQQ
ncbi:MAG: hypothetical protein ACK4RX_11445 [Chitinophagaceae bacterium]